MPEGGELSYSMWFMGYSLCQNFILEALFLNAIIFIIFFSIFFLINNIERNTDYLGFPRDLTVQQQRYCPSDSNKKVDIK